MICRMKSFIISIVLLPPNDVSMALTNEAFNPSPAEAATDARSRPTDRVSECWYDLEPRLPRCPEPSQCSDSDIKINVTMRVESMTFKCPVSCISQHDTMTIMTHSWECGVRSWFRDYEGLGTALMMICNYLFVAKLIKTLCPVWDISHWHRGCIRCCCDHVFPHVLWSLCHGATQYNCTVIHRNFKQL